LSAFVSFQQQSPYTLIFMWLFGFAEYNPFRLQKLFELCRANLNLKYCELDDQYAIHFSQVKR